MSVNYSELNEKITQKSEIEWWNISDFSYFQGMISENIESGIHGQITIKYNYKTAICLQTGTYLSNYFEIHWINSVFARFTRENY